MILSLDSKLDMVVTQTQSKIGAYPGPRVSRHTSVNDQHEQLKLDFRGIYMTPALQISPNTEC